MKLHEYQAKGLFRDYGVSVPDGIVAETVDAAVDAARRLEEENDATLFIVKAQIHAGGRGKGGGVKLAHSVEEVREHAGNILGMDLVTHQTGPEGQTVRKILVTEGVDIDQEYYLGVTLDRETSMNAIMVSTEGGVDIETVAEESPEKIQRVWVDPSIGLRPFQTRQLAFAMGLEGDAFKQAVASIQGLYEAFEENDCTLAEINPLVQTPGGDIEAVDAKVNLDDNALFRHPDLEEMRDLHEEDPTEVKAGEHGLSYITLDGNVGCMVNGAGLAMATMDIIKLAGGEPANFLDVGGAASAETVEAGFRIILEDPNVEALLLNIFGGIVRCDRVAQGVIEAAKNIDIDVPLIVRLQGTNAEEGKRLLDESDLSLRSAVLLKEAADEVTAALGED
ncbi:ADP-forming succinate--CoA ligase subunit beta [Salinibacter ruber]|jgi:succinyl-CoA synthetase beta subunit|uniref:Succinate--CoA ligase [ADP-forming] subunit beta n=1 Tax=Salinibacter ruber TaxID=146919 RepID=A0A9X2UM25_9BACT|nr:ADP-forming succinate--CoA ligase subunit beta [Salinibacter ruber]MBB4090576.1 succinyl-CoA synthetase beta subunit [Salinibacter ruber]MCS3612185.1 succinyl-CoA synthetase beta subunit [Salinibacter ruber]MCS3615242.1 succinyl-CoA synthetase beta subunit [Salinibacter ruber]MCS3641965.1 succinyl-CoA synthetase beta subunit [Salinibacter ruber]MCS3647308.1 succinyl-CoA synthetase beta subunit [Salinibacter ruber]